MAWLVAGMLKKAKNGQRVCHFFVQMHIRRALNFQRF